MGRGSSISSSSSSNDNKRNASAELRQVKEPVLKASKEDLEKLDLILGKLNYPNFEEWLDKTVKEIEAGDTDCYVTRAENKVTGLIIEKPRGDRLKVATLWIDPDHRDAGVGTRIMKARQAAWRSKGWREVYLTFTDSPGYHRFFRKLGFSQIASIPDKYSEGVNEEVYSWRPES